MNDNTSHQPVNRSRFNHAVRHLETLLGQQTTILQSLAVAAVENRGRDEKTAAVAAELKEVKKEQEAMKQKFAWMTGAGAVLAGVWPMLAKKLGFM